MEFSWCGVLEILADQWVEVFCNEGLDYTTFKMKEKINKIVCWIKLWLILIIFQNISGASKYLPFQSHRSPDASEVSPGNSEHWCNSMHNGGKPPISALPLIQVVTHGY